MLHFAFLCYNEASLCGIGTNSVLFCVGEDLGCLALYLVYSKTIPNLPAVLPDCIMSIKDWISPMSLNVVMCPSIPCL